MSLVSGMKPMSTSERTSPRASRSMIAAKPRRSPSLLGVESRSTMPKSTRITSGPGRTNMFPGCGSPWNRPSEKNIWA